MPREIAFSQLPRMSAAAESGGVAASYFDRRQHAVPLDWGNAIERFLDRGPARRQPKPSDASQPMPRRHAA